MCMSCFFGGYILLESRRTLGAQEARQEYVISERTTPLSVPYPSEPAMYEYRRTNDHLTDWDSKIQRHRFIDLNFPEAPKPTRNPEIPKTRLHELLRKVRANFCLLPSDTSQEPNRDCSRKLVQMSFLFWVGLFKSGGFSSSEFSRAMITVHVMFYFLGEGAG